MFLAPAAGYGQALGPAPDSGSAIVVKSSDQNRVFRKVGVPLALAVAVVEDRQINEFVSAHRSHGADRVANTLDPFGRAQYILPVLAGSYIVSLGTNRHNAAHSILRIGISYLAADAVEAALKPSVGRHRPDSTERPFLFHPFKNDERWHSFPSAHATHTFALADAIAFETDSRWVQAGVFSTAALVAAQRVYVGAHWTSDVVASAALAVELTHIAERLARRHVH